MRSFIVILSLVFIAGSCGGDASGPSGPRTLSILAGDGSSAPVDTDVGVKVKLVDSSGQPITGETVTWTVTAGDGGTVTPTSVTASDGSASATWHLGKKAGPQQVQASAPNATAVTISGTAVARDVVTLALLPADTTMKAGTTAQLRVSAKDAFDNIVSNPVLLWSSSAASVAAVNTAGLITGKLIGDATITGSAGATQARVTVHIVAGDPVSFTLSPAADTLRTAASYTQLVATLKDGGGNSLPLGAITWTSSDTTVAQVASDGRVTARRNGQVTITATMGSRTATAVITIAVTAATLVNVRFNTLTVPNTPETWVVSPRDPLGYPIDAPVTFTTNDTTLVALVRQTGSTLTFFPLKPGVVTLTAQSGTARVSVQIQILDATQYLLYPRATIVFHAIGTTQQLSVKTVHGGVPVVYSGAESIVWQSSDSSALSVGDDGTVEALAKGSATITATTSTLTAATGIAVDTMSGLFITTPNVTLGSGFGTTMQLVAEGATGGVSWSSGNSTIVSVSADGSITGLRAGSTTVTASDGAHSVSANVTVLGPATSIQLLYTAPTSMAVGSNAQIQAFAYDELGQRLDYGVESLPMTSSDPTVLRVFGNYLYAAKPGTATITLQAGTITRTFSVTVQ